MSFGYLIFIECIIREILMAMISLSGKYYRKYINNGIIDITNIFNVNKW